MNITDLEKAYDDGYDGRMRLEFPTAEMKRACHRAGVLNVVAVLQSEITRVQCQGGTVQGLLNRIRGDQ